MARPASVMMKALGACSISRVQAGASRPKALPNRPFIWAIVAAISAAVHSGRGATASASWRPQVSLVGSK